MSAEAGRLEIVDRPGGVELAVRVVPGASRTKIVGTWGAALRLAVAAPPQAGRANAAVIELLAATFGVRRGRVQILGGQRRPLKRVRITGLTAAQARRVLSGLLG